MCVDTPERWRSDVLSRSARERARTAAARFEAVLNTAAMEEPARNAWCREHNVYPQELAQWRTAATQALADPEDARASPQQTKQDQSRIKELERELRRKKKAAAEAAVLLVLSKNLGRSSTRSRARTHDRPRRSPDPGLGNRIGESRGRTVAPSLRGGWHRARTLQRWKVRISVMVISRFGERDQFGRWCCAVNGL